MVSLSLMYNNIDVAGTAFASYTTAAAITITNNGVLGSLSSAFNSIATSTYVVPALFPSVIPIPCYYNYSKFESD